MERIRYVVGFYYDPKKRRVVLIEKQRPNWQKGKLNGVGGHVESNETVAEAMRREFREEVGVDVEDWCECIRMVGETWVVLFFIAFGDIDEAATQTDEKVVRVSVEDLPKLAVIPNLRWLIPLCLDDNISKPLRVYDRTENGEEPSHE